MCQANLPNFSGYNLQAPSEQLAVALTALATKILLIFPGSSV
jgi:hypothetical protein